MIIPKISLSNSFHLKSSKTTGIPTVKKLVKINDQKHITGQNFIKKKIKIKPIKVMYKPLHPEHRFNSSSININDMMKKNNLPYITNNSIKNIILKFKEEREKERNEKRMIYKDKSYEDFQKEKNTQFLMLRAMLRRDPLTIQVLMKRNRNEEIKMRKNTSFKRILRKRLNSKKKYLNRTTIMSEDNLTYEKSHINNSMENSKSISLKKIKFSKNKVWKNDILLKVENIKKLHLKKNEIKIRIVNSLILAGRLSPFRRSNYSNKKFNQDCVYTNIDLISSKLDEISLFGIFDGNGQYGKSIALAFKNYVVDYFLNCNEMRVTLKKDNFYSILYNSFVFAQNYLINNSNKLNINMNFSGATGIIVLYPHNNTNKVYCANIGRNKCIFYTMTGPIKLSYELYPNRASEKDRIERFKEQNKEKLKNKKNENNKEEEDENNNKEKNIILIDQKRKELFLKEFIELDISRCIGNLAAEELGIIPGPEIGESDIKLNKGKFIVIGTKSLWKYLTEEEVGDIVNLHYPTYDCEGACKDLQDLAKDRWKEKNDGAYDDISVVIIFFDAKNL
jgi:serine/threonine protein phosphatase PrpC